MIIVEFPSLLATLMQKEMKGITVNFVESNPECTNDKLMF